MTRIALVTGANRGLGRATAVALARNTIKVVAASRGSSSEVVDEIVASGGEAIAVELDVADTASIEAARIAVLAGIRQEWNASTIDVLVNNAGVGCSRRSAPSRQTTSMSRSPSTSVVRFSSCRLSCPICRTVPAS